MQSSYELELKKYRENKQQDYIKQKKEEALKELLDFLNNVQDYDQTLERFKQSFYTIFSDQYVETISQLMEQLATLESEADILATKEFLNKELYQENFTQCRTYLKQLLENQSLLSKHCYTSYVIPLINNFWNFKSKLEKYCQEFSIETPSSSKTMDIHNDAKQDVTPVIVNPELPKEISDDSKKYKAIANNDISLTNLKEEIRKLLPVEKLTERMRLVLQFINSNAIQDKNNVTFDQFWLFLVKQNKQLKFGNRFFESKTLFDEFCLRWKQKSITDGSNTQSCDEIVERQSGDTNKIDATEVNKDDDSVLSRIPSELLHMIFRNFDLTTLYLASIVSKLWRSIIVDSKLVWRNRQFTSYSDFLNKKSIFFKMLRGEDKLLLLAVKYKVPKEQIPKEILTATAIKAGIHRQTILAHFSQIIQMLNEGFPIKLLGICRSDYGVMSLILKNKIYLKEITIKCDYKYLESIHPMQLKHILESGSLIVEMLNLGLPYEALSFAQNGPDNFYPTMYQNKDDFIKLWLVHRLPNWRYEPLRYYDLLKMHPERQKRYVTNSTVLCQLADAGIPTPILLKFGDLDINLSFEVVKTFSVLVEKYDIPVAIWEKYPNLSKANVVNHLGELLKKGLPCQVFNLSNDSEFLIKNVNNLKQLFIDNGINPNEILKKHPVEREKIISNPEAYLERNKNLVFKKM